MFLCPPCHVDVEARLPIRLDNPFPSRGVCESCGDVSECVDCHCTSPEIEAEVAQVVTMARAQVAGLLNEAEDVGVETTRCPVAPEGKDLPWHLHDDWYADKVAALTGPRWAVVRNVTPEHGMGGGQKVHLYSNIIDAKAAAWDARQDGSFVAFTRTVEGE